MGTAQERVLQAVARGKRYGFEIMTAAAMTSGAVYQALAGLERRGFVRSRWESADVAEEARRPRRKYYDITRPGRDALREVAERYRAFQRDMPAEFSPDPRYDSAG